MIKDVIKSFGKQIIFWFLFFALSRVVFLVYYHKYLLGVDLVSILGVFWHGLHLDLSTVCYIMAVPLIWVTMQAIIAKRWMNTVLFGYHAIMIFVYSLIIAGEMGVYEEWQTKLSAKVIKYLVNPGEVYNSASTGVFFVLLLIWITMFSAGLLCFRKWFWHKIIIPVRPIYYAFIFFIVTLPCVGIFIRGGLQQIPINQSDAYFSKCNMLNLVAVNSGWNMLHSMSKSYSSLDGNPFCYYKQSDAEKMVRALHCFSSDSTVKFLAVNNPNVVMIVLEGWSADLVESLGGEKGITPCFRTLEKEGVLYSNIFSSGARSEQGLASIFSAFPSTPLSQIARQPDKFVKLQSLTQQYGKKGYHTSFYFGGDLNYGNIKGYIYFNKFDRIIDYTAFGDDIPQGKLGVHDQYVYSQWLNDLNKEKTPFFSTFFTLSSHSPYDIPNYTPHIQWPTLEREYVNAAYYADSCMGDFIKKAKQQPWYKNTLFVVVADHGHSSYKSRPYWDKDYQKIPLLFFGDVIKDDFKGTVCDKIGSQVDIAATLLRQCGMKSDQFRWSKDLQNPCNPGFAYYAFEVGLGFVTTEGDFVYEHNMNKYFREALPVAKKDSVEKAGKAYLQEVYQEYWGF